MQIENHSFLNSNPGAETNIGIGTRTGIITVIDELLEAYYEQDGDFKKSMEAQF